MRIYSYYVKETAASFEYAVPSVEEFTGRIKLITRKYPYPVHEEEGKLLGYAHAGAYSEREACNRTAVL